MFEDASHAQAMPYVLAALFIGDSVLDGSSTLTLQVGCLQHLTQLFERHLPSRTHQHGFLALPSHPADTASLLEVQFLFDMLQKTVSLKVLKVLMMLRFIYDIMHLLGVELDIDRQKKKCIPY